MKRANEEVEILEIEFERSIRWFLKNSENWTTMAERERRAGASFLLCVLTAGDH
jgi:hypothetical protein